MSCKSEPDLDLGAYFETIKSEVEQLAEREDIFLQEAFTEWVAHSLVEEAELGESFEKAQFAREGRSPCRVDGYSVASDTGRLDLLVSDFEGGPTHRTLTHVEARRLAGLGVAFFRLVLSESPADLVDPAFEAAARMIHDVKEAVDDLTHVRVVLVTDALVKDREVDALQVGSYRVDADVWDLARLARRFSGGTRSREDIVIDFEKLLGAPLACLPAPSSDPRYRAYLAILSGDALVQIYAKYRARLLEANVRSFLQARGGVNRGIRDTLLNDPRSFFAYNNGLSVTIDDADLVKKGNQEQIRLIRGLQIVNGAQTTASIHRAAHHDNADLSGVFIPVKITLVNGNHLEEMVPNISRYSNSQNAIKVDDFTANHPFHRALEQLSRSVWLPGESARWFYERARGQYQVEQARATTPAQRRDFAAQTPKSRVFTKTDMAKYFMAWDASPHIVSLGAQKCFVRFMDDVVNASRITVEPDADWYKDVIGKTILFKAAQQAARKESSGSYRANVVAYSVALLATRAGEAFSLRTLWDEQRVSAQLQSLLETWAPLVHSALVQTAGSRNVTEWCKKLECWQALQRIKLPGTVARLPEVDAGHLRVTSAIENAGLADGLQQNRSQVIAAARKLSEGMVLPRETLLRRLAESLGINRLNSTTRQQLEAALDELAETAFLDSEETQATNELLAAIRKAARVTGEREPLMRQVAGEVLGVQRLGKSARATVEDALLLAAKRNIITQTERQVALQTPTFDSYDDDMLCEALLGVLQKKNRSYFKDDAINALVASLGFSQCRAAMRQRVENVVARAVASGALSVPQPGKLKRES